MIPKLEKLKFQDKNSFFLIAGPCVVEDDETPFIIADELVKLCNKFEIPLIFKSSYKKANRSRLDSFTGIGDFEGLKIIERIGNEYNIPTITDVHTDTEAVVAAEYVDILQIPAFLCRQTELLLTAAAIAFSNTINILRTLILLRADCTDCKVFCPQGALPCPLKECKGLICAGYKRSLSP